MMLSLAAAEPSPQTSGVQAYPACCLQARLCGIERKTIIILMNKLIFMILHIYSYIHIIPACVPRLPFCACHGTFTTCALRCRDFLSVRSELFVLVLKSRHFSS